jgi:plastocyanin
MKQMKILLKAGLHFVILLALSFNTAAAETIRGTVRYASSEDAGKAVVYIEKAYGTFIPSKKNPIIDQIDMAFVPYVLPLLVGTTVDFHNSDGLLNNIYSPSWAGYKFNLGTYPKGVVRPFTFDRLGEIIVRCNIHPQMEAYILALQNPYFAVPDKDGKYQIKDIPPGSYNLKMWYKKSVGPAKKITVEKEKDTLVDFR